MRVIKLLAFVALSSLASVGETLADEVTYFEKDGVTYRETRRKISRPVSELRYNQQAQTIYREKIDYGTQDVVRTYQTPVTQYQPVTRMVGRWNPFIRQPYYEQRQVPTTHWETRSEIVQVPCAKRSVVPETTNIQVPVVSTRMVDDEVISRVAVGTRATGTTVAASPPPAAPSSFVAGAPAQATPIGGVSKLDQDPPRIGNNVQWRGSTRR